MFEVAQREGMTHAWVMRLIGFLLLAVGVFLVLRPLAVLADVIPFAGWMVTVATALFAAAVALGLSLVTIAFGWLFYRPLLGGGLLAVGLLGIGGLYLLARRKRT
jgi:hypothetical protein